MQRKHHTNGIHTYIQTHTHTPRKSTPHTYSHTNTHTALKSTRVQAVTRTHTSGPQQHKANVAGKRGIEKNDAPNVHTPSHTAASGTVARRAPSAGAKHTQPQSSNCTQPHAPRPRTTCPLSRSAHPAPPCSRRKCCPTEGAPRGGPLTRNDLSAQGQGERTAGAAAGKGAGGGGGTHNVHMCARRTGTPLLLTSVRMQMYE